MQDGSGKIDMEEMRRIRDELVSPLYTQLLLTVPLCTLQLKRKLKTYCDLTTDEELAAAMNDPEYERVHRYILMV